MSDGIVKRFTGTLSLLLLIFTEGYPQEAIVPPPVRLMFYNVENLFDTFNDTLTDDDEFLPQGLRRWSYKRYSGKLSALYKTIIAAGEWDTPSLIGFCEVENRNILEDLIYSTGLAKYDWGILHEDSPDPRGIDVCLIYRKDLVKIIDFRYLIPEVFINNKTGTRSVLYAKIQIREDTIGLFLNHWPSRRGGVLAGETQRQQIAEMVRVFADSLFSASERELKIIIAGDFNSTPDDKAVGLLTGSSEAGLSIVNLSAGLPAGAGTYRYMGTWEIIDQVIVSGDLINCRKGLYTDEGFLTIFQPVFLLKPDPKYPGMSPFSTYLGYRYQGGFSDHLPVLLDLRIR
jgi:hypothetical protein